jgi:hypothetical protein
MFIFGTPNKTNLYIKNKLNSYVKNVNRMSKTQKIIEHYKYLIVDYLFISDNEVRKKYIDNFIKNNKNIGMENINENYGLKINEIKRKTNKNMNTMIEPLLVEYKIIENIEKELRSKGILNKDGEFTKKKE